MAIDLGEKECFSEAIKAYDEIYEASKTNAKIRLTAKVYSGIDYLNLENPSKANKIFKEVYDEARKIEDPSESVILIAIRAGLTYAMMENTSDTDTHDTLNEIVDKYEDEANEEIREAVDFVRTLKELYDDEELYDE